MNRDYQAASKELMDEFKDLREAIPETTRAFGKLHHAAMGAGALDAKSKELIALGIGIYARCEGCVVAHARGALKQGATLEEIAEAIGVAVVMGGGPATVYGSKALAAAKQFAE